MGDEDGGDDAVVVDTNAANVVEDSDGREEDLRHREVAWIDNGAEEEDIPWEDVHSIRVADTAGAFHVRVDRVTNVGVGTFVACVEVAVLSRSHRVDSDNVLEEVVVLSHRVFLAVRVLPLVYVDRPHCQRSHVPLMLEKGSPVATLGIRFLL